MMSTSVTQPIRIEHASLMPQIEKLIVAARAVRHPSERGAVYHALEFLTHDLLPHAAAEDTVLYPAVARVLDDSRAMETMSRDHVEIARLADRLAAVYGEYLTFEDPDRVVEELREVLYGLYAVVKLHVAKEEEILLPLLDAALTPGEAGELFARMRDAAEAARPAP